MEEKISVPKHSSICIRSERTVYIDPYQIDGEPHDADVICITHDHYDHFSPEDIEKIRKEDTVYVLPAGMKSKASDLGAKEGNIIGMKAGEKAMAAGIPAEAVAAYNNLKPFHPKSKGWLGYVLTMEGQRIYIAGDTDSNEENRRVKCDIALVPIGGFYTMDAKKAAEFVNIIQPGTAIPVHYGSIVGKPEDAAVFSQNVKESIRVVTKISF